MVQRIQKKMNKLHLFPPFLLAWGQTSVTLKHFKHDPTMLWMEQFYQVHRIS
jgi:hypothetical protein